MQNYYYNEELKNKDTNYFIIDSGSNVEHEDIDFKIYSWRKDLNKKIKPGDLFIYRRSGGGSEYRNQFYLFGSGKLGETMKNSLSNRAIIKIDQPFVFDRKLFKSDLENFDWKFKKHHGLWSNFFNMNGITQITQADFTNLLIYQEQLCGDVLDLSQSEEKLAAYIYQSEQLGEFFVEDRIGELDTYNPAQKVFTDLILANYNYQCAITKETEIRELTVVRIVSWVDEKNSRMDFRNGICLTKWLAEAFEAGQIAFSGDGKMLISAQTDSALLNKLSSVQYKKLPMHKRYSPKKEYLEYHREHVFLRK